MQVNFSNWSSKVNEKKNEVFWNYQISIRILGIARQILGLLRTVCLGRMKMQVLLNIPLNFSHSQVLYYTAANPLLFASCSFTYHHTISSTPNWSATSKKFPPYTNPSNPPTSNSVPSNLFLNENNPRSSSTSSLWTPWQPDSDLLVTSLDTTQRSWISYLMQSCHYLITVHCINCKRYLFL